MVDQRMKGSLQYRKGNTQQNVGTPQTRLYMGIDPGNSGGIAVISGDKSFKYLLSLKELNCRAIWNELSILTQLGNSNHSLTVIMEQVVGYQGKGEGQKGGGAANGSAMFKFGSSYGRLQMALTGHELKWKEVPPNIWQKEFIDNEVIDTKDVTDKDDIDKKLKPHSSIGTFSQKEKMGSKDKVSHKRQLKLLARELFPNLKSITLQTCDALLLSEYLRRREENKYATTARV